MSDSPRSRVVDFARRFRRYLLEASRVERVGLSVAAFLASLIVGALFILGAGVVATCGSPFATIGGASLCYNPLSVYLTMASGAVGSMFNLSLTLSETTFLIFTGASVAIAFKGGLFNIGAQGQLILGALATALVALFASPYVPSNILGAAALIPLGIAVGALVGAGYAAIPGILKAYADANEVITTILLNFVAEAVASVLVIQYFKAPNTASVMTRAVPEFALIHPVLFPKGSDFSIYALIGAMLVLVGLYGLIRHTTFGYDVRIRGIQATATTYARVDDKRITVWTMVISGALAGIAGAIYVLMVLNRWRAGIPALGFDGIAVSVLAGNNPAGILPAALLFGLLKSGSVAIDLNLGIPRQLTGVLRGLIILFVAMPEFLRQFARHRYSERLLNRLEGGSQ